MSPEIVRRDTFSLHIYREFGGQHHLPHCHVRRRDGAAETLVSLPLLDLIAGPEPSKAEWEVIVECLQELINAWDGLND